MLIKSKVKSKTRELDNLIRRVSGFGTKTVEAGYYSTQMHPKYKMPLSTIAAINEFGYFGIPARNFMWQSFWIYKSRKNYSNMKYLFTNLVYKKGKSASLLKEVGEDMTSQIKWTIAWEGNFVDNSPVTIKYKGKNYPLVDTGYLRDNSKYKITTKK